MLPKKIILLLSGGLDSVTLLHQLIKEGNAVHCLTVDYGQRHAVELVKATAAARSLDVKLTKWRIPRLGGLTLADGWIVPNRNAIFANLAANIAIKAGADTIALGCNGDDHESFPDCREEFRQSLNLALKTGGTNVEVCMPYMWLDKSEIANLAKKFGIRRKDVWTCYMGGTIPCGECPACEKMEAAW